MTPENILRRLWADGVRLALIGDERLTAYPSEHISPENLALCRRHKPELIAFMKAARLTTAELVDTAMDVCAAWGDGPEAREQMRQDVQQVPPHLRADLLDCLRKAYLGKRGHP